MTEFKNVVLHFKQWLAEHNIDSERVHIEITFPEAHSVAHAEAQIHREWDWATTYYADGYGTMKVEDIQVRVGRHERNKWLP